MLAGCFDAGFCCVYVTSVLVSLGSTVCRRLNSTVWTCEQRTELNSNNKIKFLPRTTVILCNQTIHWYLVNFNGHQIRTKTVDSKSGDVLDGHHSNIEYDGIVLKSAFPRMATWPLFINNFSISSDDSIDWDWRPIPRIELTLPRDCQFWSGGNRYRRRLVFRPNKESLVRIVKRIEDVLDETRGVICRPSLWSRPSRSLYIRSKVTDMELESEDLIVCHAAECDFLFNQVQMK